MVHGSGGNTNNITAYDGKKSNECISLLSSHIRDEQNTSVSPTLNVHQSCSGRGQFTQFSMNHVEKIWTLFFMSEGEKFVRRRQVPLLSNVYFIGRSRSYSLYSFQIPARFRLIIR